MVGAPADLQEVSDGGNGRGEKCSNRIDGESEGLNGGVMPFDDSDAFFDAIYRDDSMFGLVVRANALSLVVLASNGDVASPDRSISPELLCAVLDSKKTSEDDGEYDQEDARSSV